jgi:hypothetical protein
MKTEGVSPGSVTVALCILKEKRKRPTHEANYHPGLIALLAAFQ